MYNFIQAGFLYKFTQSNSYETWLFVFSIKFYTCTSVFIYDTMIQTNLAKWLNYDKIFKLHFQITSFCDIKLKQW